MQAAGHDARGCAERDEQAAGRPGPAAGGMDWVVGCARPVAIRAEKAAWTAGSAWRTAGRAELAELPGTEHLTETADRVAVG